MAWRAEGVTAEEPRLPSCLPACEVPAVPHTGTGVQPPAWRKATPAFRADRPVSATAITAGQYQEAAH